MRYVALDREITLEFHRLSLEQALRRILRHCSFVLEYAAAQPRTLWILPQGEDEYAAQRRVVASTASGSAGEDIYTKISKLRATLSSADAEQRQEATLELGESGHVDAVVPLTLALADKDEDVREAAVISLAEIGGAEAVQALAIALRDENPRVREEAVDALGEIGGKVAIGLLEQALADDVRFVRQAATEVLDELRGAAQ
jgi:HEAT repeat protein